MTAMEGIRMDESLWRTFTSLLDGPSTARGVATRLGRPLATVVRDLGRLQEQGLVNEAKADRVGSLVERVYCLPSGTVRVKDAGALTFAFKEIERGLTLTQFNRRPAHAGMVTVRLSAERAAQVMAQLQALREELEAEHEDGAEVKVSVFVAGWGED